MARRLLLALVVAAVAAAPAQARSAVQRAACGTTPGLQCLQVRVPLDRTGVVPGTITLHVEYLPANTDTPRGTFFLIAGGPGQGSARAFRLGRPFDAALNRAMLPGYNFVAFDNRGTGASDVLNCPALQRTLTATVERYAALVGNCAATIGSRRVFYSTRDHAEDIDAVRQALGFHKIGLFGVSYGTKLALAYALAHPERVDRLLLDSVVPPDLPDPFERNVLRAMPRTLNAFCAGGRCRGATTNYARDVATLANRIEAQPIRGSARAAPGAAKTYRMTGEDLLGLVRDTDLNPGLAAELPAAVRAALRGEIRALLRLFAIDLRTSNFSALDLSAGLNAATNCADGRFPWAPETPIAQRPALLAAAVAAQPAGAFGPFGKWAARLGTAYACERWPSPAGQAALGSGPLPDVPVLAVSGGLDFRTPTANAAAIVSMFPHGQLLVVPGVGHSVLSTDLSFCSLREVRFWAQGLLARSRCPRVPALVRTLPPLPGAARKTPAATAVVAARTLTEAEAGWTAGYPDVQALAGLAGGRLVRSRNGFRLVNYSLVPGVRLTGTLNAKLPVAQYRFGGTVTVSGPKAVRGTLRVTNDAIAGRLGGHRVTGHT